MEESRGPAHKAIWYTAQHPEKLSSGDISGVPDLKRSSKNLPKIQNRRLVGWRGSGCGSGSDFGIREARLAAGRKE